MSGRLNQEREAELQPKRLASTKEKLEQLGYTVEVVDHTQIRFKHNGNRIDFWPYSGWFSGKGVGSGRGFGRLLRALDV